MSYHGRGGQLAHLERGTYYFCISNQESSKVKTQPAMKSNEGCCHFVKATDNNKPKQN